MEVHHTVIRHKTQRSRTAWRCIIPSLDTKHREVERHGNASYRHYTQNTEKSNGIVVHHTVIRHKTQRRGKPNVASHHNRIQNNMKSFLKSSFYYKYFSKNLASYRIRVLGAVTVARNPEGKTVAILVSLYKCRPYTENRDTRSLQ